MKIWRVEDENQVGPFHKLVAEQHDDDLISPTAYNMATIMHDWTPYDNDLDAHTAPRNDARLMRPLGERNLDDYLFAFSSPKQMREWLYKDSWIRTLDQYKMFVAIYFVDENLIIGDTQVLIPKGLMPLEICPIAEYFSVARSI